MILQKKLKRIKGTYREKVNYNKVFKMLLIAAGLAIDIVFKERK